MPWSPEQWLTWEYTEIWHPTAPVNNPSIQWNISLYTKTALHLTTVSKSTAALHLTGKNAFLLRQPLANGYCIKANILFNEGSQQSFVTESLAASLNLRHHTQKRLSFLHLTLKVPTPRKLMSQPFTWKPYLARRSHHPCWLSPKLQHHYNTWPLPALQSYHISVDWTWHSLELQKITLRSLLGHCRGPHNQGKWSNSNAVQAKVLLSGPVISPPGSKDTANSILHDANQYTPDISTVEKF